MRKITVYKYEELPTQEAKNEAISWWRETETIPPWREEHFHSMREAWKQAKKIITAEDRARVKEMSVNCEFTGYCADALLSSLMDKRQDQPIHYEHIEKYYNEAWEEELKIMDEDSYIVENLNANEYEFLSNGERVEAPDECRVCSHPIDKGEVYCLRCDNEVFDAMCEAAEERQRRGEE